MLIALEVLMFSWASFLYRFTSDLTEQGGSAAPGWRTRNPPGSQLSQGHVQCGAAQWQELVSDSSRKNPQSGAACWQDTSLQVCHSLVGDLKSDLLSGRVLCIPVLPMMSSRSTEVHVCRPEGLSTAFVSLTMTLTAVPCWLSKQPLGPW